MSDMDPVERVARAIHEASGEATPWDEASNWMRSAGQKMARAAIAAMSVPCPRPFNDDPQDLTADECVRLGHCGCGHVAAMPQGEPVAWRYRYENEGGKWTAWRISRNHPNGGVEYPDCEVQPLYAAPAMPVAEAGVREALEPFKKYLEQLRERFPESTPDTIIIGGPYDLTYAHFDKLLVALSTSPSDGEG